MLAARSFTGVIRDTKRVTSFTGLTHGRAIEAPDYDAADREPPLEAMPRGRDIFSFPRGAQAGKCLHAIFENVDFTCLARPELERVVGRELTAHGFESIWVHAVADMSNASRHATRRKRALRSQVPVRAPRRARFTIARQSFDQRLETALMSGLAGDIREKIGELASRSRLRRGLAIVFEQGGRYTSRSTSRKLGPTSSYQHDALRKRWEGRRTIGRISLLRGAKRICSCALASTATRRLCGVRYLFVAACTQSGRDARRVRTSHAGAVEALDVSEKGAVCLARPRRTHGCLELSDLDRHLVRS